MIHGAVVNSIEITLRLSLCINPNYFIQFHASGG